jgi:acetyl esterase/lipase
MTANAPKIYDLAVEDVEYLRHGDTPLLARLFRPRGQGPFPLIVELHGGAWNLGDRLQDTDLNAILAQSGMVVAALDFRMPPVASYPASLVDINYAIRWFKARATEFGSRPDWVGAFGISSGGHMAMLAGIRPHDPRYAAIPLPAGSPTVDARLRCVIMGAPVIDPLGRYRYAKQMKEGGEPYPEFVDLVLPLHDKFWQSEDAMAEGSPVRALERGERVELPPVLYIQDTKDIIHPRADLDRFVAQYRQAGGQVELELFEGASDGFAPRNPSSHASVRALGRMYETRDPSSPAAARMREKIIAFVHQQIQ